MVIIVSNNIAWIILNMELARSKRFFNQVWWYILVILALTRGAEADPKV